MSIIASREISKPYNLILTWLKNLPKNQIEDPIGTLCDYVELEEANEITRLVRCLKKGFVGAIKTLLTSYTHKQCIVFSGPSGVGKTPFFRSFLPPDLYEDYFKSVQLFNPANKDSMQTLTRYFVGLIDEIKQIYER